MNHNQREEMSREKFISSWLDDVTNSEAQPGVVSAVREEPSSVISTIYTLPDLTNDEKAPVVPYTEGMTTRSMVHSIGINKHSCNLYCGRYFGTDIIPESDGRCGPDNGPPCPSCRRLREEDFKIKRDMLKRLFPGLYILCSNRSIITNGWINVSDESTEKDEDGNYIVNLEQYSGYATADNNDDESHFLDKYLIKKLRTYQGHLGKCMEDIEKQYFELQMECNASFEFPSSSASSTRNINNGNSNNNYGNSNIFSNEGSYSNSKDSDESLHTIQPISGNIALSKPRVSPPNTSEYINAIQTISAVAKIDASLAEFLFYDTHYDIDATLDVIMNEGLNGLGEENNHNLDIIERMREYDNEREKTMLVLTQERNKQITYAVEHSKEMIKNDLVVGRIKQWKESLNTKLKFEPLINDDDVQNPPPMVSSRGHRMLLANKEKPFYCRTCTSPVPSKVGGLYYSEQCKMCEGCVQTPYSSIQVKEAIDVQDEEDIDRLDYAYLYCPMNLNGGHLHCLPLKPANGERINCICDICDECDVEIAWYDEDNDFDVCIDCIHKPPPKNYCRKEHHIVAINNGDSETLLMKAMAALFGDNVDDEIDSDNEHNQNKDEEPQFFISHNFDDTGIESIVAAHWGTKRPNGRSKHRILLGNGIVCGNPEDIDALSAPTPDNRILIPTNINNDGNLPEEAMNALYILEQPSLDVRLRSAADIAKAEDILRRVAPSIIPQQNQSYMALLDCISAGRVGLAGTLLLSYSYAPMCIACTNPDESSNEQDNPDEELICSCCFEIINERTAPDGAVGCLSGHAMHAACAADLLLGGGKCPVCRRTLFYSKVAESEIEAAVKFTENEISRLRMEEEGKVRNELEELARDSLPVRFSVGDVVCISEDKDFCRRVQCQDPASGWWHNDMASGCGAEGFVTDIITGIDNKAVSIRVKSSSCHEFQLIRRLDDYECNECHSTSVGLRRCIHCKTCELCCHSKFKACNGQSQESYWDPLLLTLLRRINGTSSLALMDTSEAYTAEKHILRLKGELIAIKAARESLKESMNKFTGTDDLMKKSRLGRSLTNTAYEAIVTMAMSGIAQPDWQRAKHLLTLIEQWDQSGEANAKRIELYTAVKEGNLDSVARIVRRYNAKQTAETAKWADAMSKTNKYVVEPWVSVDLRVYPRSNAPRTGVILEPNTIFSSAEEVLDKDGNMWIKIDPQSVETKNDYSLLPQGWIRIRPNGDGYAPIVRKEKSCLQCFCCGDDLIPQVPGHEKYLAAQKDELKVGDIVLVSATLEQVQVQSVNEKYVKCLHVSENHKECAKCDSILYRPCDLVVPKLGRNDDDDEILVVNGRLRNRRELVLSHDGNEGLARLHWNAAKKEEKHFEKEFSSCLRGHLLHARCLQLAILMGSGCPACKEPLFFPKVTRETTNGDDSCCEGNSRNTEAMEALEAASQLSGHSALVETRTNEGIREINANEALFANQALKMCPYCCSGPLFNQECSDMRSHHGQCSMKALKGKDKRPCTPNGDFNAPESEIASRLSRISTTKSVADLLPRCQTHNCVIMFNGCMNCGHLFTDTDWNDLPDWNPNAIASLEFDKKRRNAARLLMEQITYEASILQFERDAYYEARGDVHCIENRSGGWSTDTLHQKVINPPPRRPKEESHKEQLRIVYISA